MGFRDVYSLCFHAIGKIPYPRTCPEASFELFYTWRPCPASKFMCHSGSHSQSKPTMWIHINKEGHHFLGSIKCVFYFKPTLLRFCKNELMQEREEKNNHVQFENDEDVLGNNQKPILKPSQISANFEMQDWVITHTTALRLVIAHWTVFKALCVLVRQVKKKLQRDLVTQCFADEAL